MKLKDNEMVKPLEESALSTETAVGLVGLRNLGNTCFMNSALQILTNCLPFTKLFFARVQNLPISSHYPLSKAYLNLLFEMGYFDEQNNLPRSTWSSCRRPAVSPYDILNVIRISYPTFRGVYQQDSQEFMRAFLSDLHDELKLKPFDESKFPCSGIFTTFNSNTSAVNGDRNLCIKSKNKRSKKRKTNVMSDNGPAKESFPGLSSSAVMDVFQGALVTCIKCLSCEKVFHRNEVFLDLSLPVVTSQSKPKITDTAVSPHSNACSFCPLRSPLLPSNIVTTGVPSTSVSSDKNRLIQNPSAGFIYWASFYLILVLAWLKNISPIPLVVSYLALVTSWVKRSALNWGYVTAGVGNNLIWNPHLELEDCLDAFFDVDELFGENQYYCENCSRHTNGRMHAELTKLPEVLCLHLKRFRHDFMNTSKIYSPVKFPLEHLNLKKYRHSSCRDKVYEYDLVGVVCHSGTVRFGHYYTYALNSGDGEWYEFNDSSVQRVDAEIILSLTSEAYVLVYRKRQDFIYPIREKFAISESPQMVYISLQWLLKFSEFADPGPITNFDFLCNHGAFQPLLSPEWDKHVAVIPLDTWNFLLHQFSGGPFVSSLLPCEVCSEKLRMLDARRQAERKAFQEAPEESELIFIINRDWLKIWANFACGREIEPPGPISNTPILVASNAMPGIYRIRLGVTTANYDWLSQPRWTFLLSAYGGGPEHWIKNPSYSEAKLGNIKPTKSLEEELEVGATDQKEDICLEEVGNKSSSSGSVYLSNDEASSSAKDASSSSLLSMLENSSKTVIASSENFFNSNSPLIDLNVRPRPASVVGFTYDSPFTGDEGFQSVHDFVIVNGHRSNEMSRSSSPTSAFGDVGIASVCNEDKNMESDGSLQGRNEAVNRKKVDEKKEEQAMGRAKVL